MLSSQASVGLAGALFAGLSVGAGAFGTHTLRVALAPTQLEVFETAARYQMYHGLALLLIAALWPALARKWAALSARAIVIGIVLFSGSLYALTLTGVSLLGLITPFGGFAFLLGWGVLAFSFYARDTSRGAAS